MKHISILSLVAFVFLLIHCIYGLNIESSLQDDRDPISVEDSTLEQSEKSTLIRVKRSQIALRVPVKCPPHHVYSIATKKCERQVLANRNTTVN
uniref:Putative secreted peptide n=1 Tax=Anopheles braziliensis TaxID=58242 RepID=A0A2M3ZWQ1_9DIPT